jgi:hypothetical protein
MTSLSSQLSDALIAFTQNRSVNLLGATESLTLLVDLTTELSTQLGVVGGTRARSILESTPPTSDANQSPSLYAIVEETVQAACKTYDAFAAARAMGKFKRELKHFESLLPLGEPCSRAPNHHRSS